MHTLLSLATSLLVSIDSLSGLLERVPLLLDLDLLWVRTLAIYT